jgi:type I restriction enzyme R subunit
MMNLIDGRQEGQVKFGPGHFDLVIIDEAHRSVYQRFRAIFEYFDGFLVGLTATPKDEIDKNTYSLFDLEDGVPTDAYSLNEAVADGVLVPPKAISVPLKIVRSGLRYDELSDEEKDQWDTLEWGEDEIPDLRGQQTALQRGHRRSRHCAPDGERPKGRGRRQAREDHHLRQKPSACALH